VTDRVVVRSVETGDAAAVGALAGELGYEIDPATVASSIERLHSSATAFIALLEDLAHIAPTSRPPD